MRMMIQRGVRSVVFVRGSFVRAREGERARHGGRDAPAAAPEEQTRATLSKRLAAR